LSYIVFVPLLVISCRRESAAIWIAVLVSALWAAYDSDRLQFRRYKSDIPYTPVFVFAACAMFWIIGFPWYLTMRKNIKTGKAVLRDEAKDDAV